MHPKTREQRLRNAAKRRGYLIEKVRRHDPLALDYGQIRLVDLSSRRPVLVTRSLDEIEEFISKPRSEVTVPDPSAPAGYRKVS